MKYLGRYLALAACMGAVVATGACGKAVPASAADSDYAHFLAFVEAADQEDMARDPTLRTYKSVTPSEPDWTLEGDAYFDASVMLINERIQDLAQQVDRAALTPEQRYQYDIYVDELKAALLNYRILRNGFNLDVNVFDPSWKLPEALVRFHKIDSIQDASNYVARLNALPGVLEVVLKAGTERLERGVVMLPSEYASMGERALQLSRGVPCAADGGRDHVLYEDFRKRLDTLSLSESEQDALLQAARQALTSNLCPAYAHFGATVSAMAPKGRSQGVWSLPNGRETYLDMLEFILGERADPEQIHQTGLEEVERIRGELDVLLAELGIEGGLEAFDRITEQDPRYSVPNNQDGRERNLAAARERNDWIQARFAEKFKYVPMTQLEVRPSTIGPDGKLDTSITFYTPAPRDASAPAYFNLGAPPEPPEGPERVSTLIRNAVTYHEGYPGHHLQQATAQELKPRIPPVRYYGYMSYLEGWGMYGEHVADELGGFADKYERVAWMRSRLGRASRLVVDTGINYLGWTPEQVMAYQQEVLGQSGSAQRSLEWPVHTIGYYWGYLQFLEMRRTAEAALGERFSLKEFHHLLLKDGAVSMRLLRQAVDDWIERERR